MTAPPAPSPSRLADHYGTVAVALHWTIAVLLLSNIGLAWYFDELRGAAKIAPIQLHKAIGITVLLLSLLRLGWRLAVPPPPLSAHLKPWEEALAHAVHWGFYIVMIGLPLTGWAMVSTSQLIHTYPINMFGLFEWPAISPLTNLPGETREDAHEALEEAHGLLAKGAYVLIVLHVAGALKHQIIDRDNELARMIPFLRRKPAPRPESSVQ